MTKIEYHREWRKKNPEKVALAARKWRLNNLEAARTASKRWNRNNPDKVKARKAIWLGTLRGRYSSLLCGSRINGRSMFLSFEDWKKIVENPCIYCGGEALSGINGYGIDRVDSAAGYTKANSVPCCAICNQIKSDLNQKLFLEQVVRIVQHQEIIDAD